MNEIPPDLRGFDFCWSACALEHLGSITHGLQFIANSLQCLRPGGICVHTTECNVSSDTDTIKDGSTVLFRKHDLSELARILRGAGHDVAEFNWDQGDDVIDQYFDLPPYRQEPHLKLRIASFFSTSVGIIIQKGGAPG